MSTLDPSGASLGGTRLVGPGAYDTVSAAEKSSLKRQPRTIIGNSKRLFLGTAPNYPAPDQYSSHHRMTERKSNSRERNAFRATIGNERKPNYDKNITPAPDSYHMKSMKTIGDDTSVHVPFGKAIRPISARPG